MKRINLLSSFILLTVFAAVLNAQSGGAFTIEKSVIAGGGGRSASGSFLLNGTIAESVAGARSTGGTFDLAGGFWGGRAEVPSSNVSVSGRVTTPGGQGLRNAVVSIIDSSGVRRTATTSSFGLYSFDLVVSGQMYILTVSSKRYRFSPQMLQINNSLTNVDFPGLE